MEALTGRLAVVTGASEGIGNAIARRLAEGGMKVAALARRPQMLQALENEMGSKGHTLRSYVCDVQDKTSVHNAFELIKQDMGGITVLVNNAGTYPLVNLLDIDVDLASTIFNTNVIGPLSCTREALASMREYSISDGHIININRMGRNITVCHRAPVREHAYAYGASKHALRHLTEGLRKELMKHKQKTRVTSISPGLVRTTMTDQFRESNPDLPYLLAEQIVDAVVYAITAPKNVNISEMIIDPV